MPAPVPLGVILSAGASRRMGRPKALLRLGDGRTLLAAHVEALAPWCAEVIVVGGAHSQVLGDHLPAEARLVHNPDWGRHHLSDSLALALGETGAEGALVTPVDAPPATGRELAALIAAPAPAVLAWQGAPGHPVLLSAEVCDRLRAGPVAGGLRALLAGAHAVPASSAAVLLNLNTPEDWAGWVADQEP